MIQIPKNFIKKLCDANRNLIEFFTLTHQSYKLESYLYMAMEQCYLTYWEGTKEGFDEAIHLYDKVAFMVYDKGDITIQIEPYLQRICGYVNEKEYYSCDLSIDACELMDEIAEIQFWRFATKCNAVKFYSKSEDNLVTVSLF